MSYSFDVNMGNLVADWIQERVKSYFDLTGRVFPDTDKGLHFISEENGEAASAWNTIDGDDWLRNNPDDHQETLSDFVDELGDVALMAIVTAMSVDANAIGAMIAKIDRKEKEWLNDQFDALRNPGVVIAPTDPAAGETVDGDPDGRPLPADPMDWTPKEFDDRAEFLGKSLNETPIDQLGGQTYAEALSELVALWDQVKGDVKEAFQTAFGTDDPPDPDPKDLDTYSNREVADAIDAAEKAIAESGQLENQDLWFPVDDPDDPIDGAQPCVACVWFFKCATVRYRNPAFGCGAFMQRKVTHDSMRCRCDIDAMIGCQRTQVFDGTADLAWICETPGTLCGYRETRQGSTGDFSVCTHLDPTSESPMVDDPDDVYGKLNQTEG